MSFIRFPLVSAETLLQPKAITLFGVSFCLPLRASYGGTCSLCIALPCSGLFHKSNVYRFMGNEAAFQEGDVVLCCILVGVALSLCFVLLLYAVMCCAVLCWEVLRCSMLACVSLFPSAVLGCAVLLPVLLCSSISVCCDVLEFVTLLFVFLCYLSILPCALLGPVVFFCAV